MENIKQDLPNEKVNLPLENDNTRQQKHKSRKKLLLIIIIFVFVVLGLGGYLSSLLISKSPEHSNQKTNAISPAISEKPEASFDNFFFFSTPKPYENLTVFQLPNTLDPANIVEYRDSLWFAGGGNIVEYDTKSGKLVSYSDKSKANCDSNVVIAANFLFAACYTDNINDAFGHVEVEKTKAYSGRYSVLKINPETHRVEYVFNDKDGLRNRYNYRLKADGDTVWVEGLKGIVKINANTNKVSSNTETQLGTDFHSETIITDKDYTWSFSYDNGLALFDKATQTWKRFTTQEIMGSNVPIKLDARPYGKSPKLVSGGLLLGISAVNEPKNNCFILKYEYITKKWTTQLSQRTESIGDCETILKPFFDNSLAYDIRKDQYGLTQINILGSSKTIQIDGRDNLIISPVIEGKRYILTNATIDVIDDSSSFRQILVKLGRRITSSLESAPFDDYYEQCTGLFIDPKSMLGVVVDAGCGGQGERDGEVWIVYLNSKKIVKFYAKVDGVSGKHLLNWTMDREGDFLVIKDNNKKPIFNINTANFVLTNL